MENIFNTRDLLVEALDKRWRKYCLEHQRTQAASSAEAVHDLRVAARRLLALLEVIRLLEPDMRVKKLHRAFKEQLDHFDELRDTQVMLAEIAIRRETLPELQLFDEFLQRREQKMLKAARKWVTAQPPAKISKYSFNLWSDLTTRENFRDPLTALDQIYAVSLQRYRQVNPARPASLHRLRIAFKKFRYSLELLAPALPGFPSDQLEHMHTYQTRLGEIQDTEVFLHSLAAFSEKRKKFDPQPVRRFYEQRHAEAIHHYLETKDAVLTFWRSTPDAHFPWEPDK